MNYHTTTIIVAGATVALILWLIRKDHLHPRLAVWWIGVSTVIALLGVFPEIADWIAHILGIHYPPTIVFVFGFAFVLVKLLRQDIARTRLNQTIIILSQRTSILEKRLEEIEEKER